MFGPISKSAFATIALSAILTFGCSSDDGGAGTAASVPANAVVIEEANAKDVVSQAAVGGSGLIDSVPLPVAIDAERAPSAHEIVQLVAEQLDRVRDLPVLNLPVGEVIDLPCDSGSITANFTESETTASGTIVFNECLLSGVTLNGTISFNAGLDPATQDYSLSLTGSLSASDGLTITTLSGLVFNETGNDQTFEYSINTYTFTLDYSDGDGFFTQLLAPIVGNEFEVCPVSPRSGVVQVTGANNTRAKGTINADGTVTIEFDDGSGTFIEVTEPPPGSPYPCSDFFV
jgi:hypothetical protein